MGTTPPAFFTQRAQQLQDQGWQQKADEQKQAIAPLAQASQAAQTRLALLADPNDPTKPVAGKETEYNAAHDQLADIIGKMRVILHPPPPDDPHGLKYLAARAADKLHITNDLAARMRDTQTGKVADANQKGRQQDYQAATTAAQGIPANGVVAFKKNLTDGGFSPEDADKAARIHFQIDPKPSAESSDTRARSDFAAYQKDHPEYKGTFEQYKTEQAAAGRQAAAPKKGLVFDKSTGQMVSKDDGKRYIEGDPENPPEVAAAFKSAKYFTAKTQALQLKLAASRGAAYNASRPITVLDSSNGNAPTVTTLGAMQKEPGRYLPASEADKAIAKENLMQDIQGTSKLTRTSINNLKEDFPEDMKAKIALAMRADDPHASLDQLISSGALGSLSPDQQDFLVATRQLAENAMAMRSILGAGQGSDDVRSAITATLPSLLSPDKSFATKQLDAFDATIARLHRGVPKVKLNNDDPNFQGPKTQQLKSLRQPPPGATHIKKFQGKEYYTDDAGNNLGEKQ